MRSLRPALLGVLLCTPATIAAQFAPLTVPRGRFAVEIRTASEVWDERFLAGTRRPAGHDFTRGALDASFFPAFAPADERLARLSGLNGSLLNLGGHSAIQITSMREFGLGVSVGVTSRLTLFGLVPIRRVRVQTQATFDPEGGSSGFNPADPTFGTPAGLNAAVAFFAQFDAAIAALADRLASGTWDNDPVTRALAESTLQESEQVRDDLLALLLTPATRSPFLPLAGSPLGAAVLSRIGALQQRFSQSLGVPGFTLQPALPGQGLTQADFDRFLTAADGPVAGSLLAPTIQTLGDIEMGAAILLGERAVGPEQALAWRSALQAVVRLRTSQLDNPDRFYDLGTGDRQPDVELRLVTDLGRGRAAIRLTGSYNLQLPGNQLRRVGPPSQPIQYADRLAAVRKDPGDVIGVSVLPGYRFTPRFAFVTGVEWWRRGADAFEWLADQPPIPGVDPDLLAEESAASAVVVRGGLTWSHPGGGRGGVGRAPLDASVTWERVMAAGGEGRVPRSEVVRATLRLYGRVW